MEEYNALLKPDVSPVDGTDDREARSAHWYVARVRMKTEKRCAERISALGYETYVPVSEEVRQWSDRKKRVERLLIPLVVFFRADEAGAREVQRQSYVYDLMRAPGERQPAKIPDQQIDSLKFMIGNCDDEIDLCARPIQAGDKVRVVRGALAGLEGYALTTTTGKAKIYITLDLFGAVATLISPTSLQKV